MCRRYKQVPLCPAAQPWCCHPHCKASLDKTTCETARGLEEKKKKPQTKTHHNQPLASKVTFLGAQPWPVAELNEILGTLRGPWCPGSVIPPSDQKGGGQARRHRNPLAMGFPERFSQ